MGFGTWTLFAIGALVGQLVTVFNFVLLGGWKYLRGEDWEVIVEQAVHRALKDCLDQETEKTSVTTSTASLSEDIIFSVRLGIEIRILIIGLVVLASLGGAWYCCGKVSRCGSLRPAIEGPTGDRDSPASSPVALQTLARNQLAEIRLRHAHKPLRLG